ncbi:PEP-CTERM sorting domain-containing protein [Massilia sp. METH4]|uniref:PEP-CTERM sorting domain-containing protein n=1 Tax=Massilia sp. METH4 TaxID=3123041 RepID=UPI0030D3A374
MHTVSSLFRHVILAATLCAAPAFADDTFTARLTNFGYTLTDLNPNDAYTPTPLDITRGNSTGSLWLVNFDPMTEIDRDLAALPGTAMSDSGQLGSYGGAWSTGTDLSQSVSLASSGYGIGWSEADWTIQITMQPNTAITLTGHLTMDWTQTGSELPGTSSGLSSVFSVGAPDWGTSEHVYTFESPDSIDTDLSITYSHRGSAPLVVYISSSLTAHSSVFAPVPEPSTYAMLVAGLAIAGWTARRRQSRR